MLPDDDIPPSEEARERSQAEDDEAETSLRRVLISPIADDDSDSEETDDDSDEQEVLPGLRRTSDRKPTGYLKGAGPFPSANSEGGTATRTAQIQARNDDVAIGTLAKVLESGVLAADGGATVCLVNCLGRLRRGDMEDDRAESVCALSLGVDTDSEGLREVLDTEIMPGPSIRLLGMKEDWLHETLNGPEIERLRSVRQTAAARADKEGFAQDEEVAPAPVPPSSGPPAADKKVFRRASMPGNLASSKTCANFTPSSPSSDDGKTVADTTRPRPASAGHGPSADKRELLKPPSTKALLKSCKDKEGGLVVILAVAGKDGVPPVWCLVRAFSVLLDGVACIFHWVTPLRTTLPEALWKPVGAQRLAVDHSVVQEALRDVRRSLQESWTQQMLHGHHGFEVLKPMMEERLEIMMNAESFAGEQYVPRLGMMATQKSTSIFQNRRYLESVFGHMFLKRSQGRQGVKEFERDVACSIADPGSTDCPLIYISEGFETLTGYTRDFALGRNFRFLQPKLEARNLAYNEEELLRIKSFCQEERKKGDMILNLLLNEDAEGVPFWNFLFMQRAITDGRPYILAIHTNLTSQKPVIDHMLPWDWTDRSVGFMAKLRTTLRQKEKTFHPEERSLLSLANETIADWVYEAGKGVDSFWVGMKFSPTVGLAAVQDFAGSFPKLLDKVAGPLSKLHRLNEQVLAITKLNEPGSIICSVADPTVVDCPLVYISQGFKDMTGYRVDFATGRNCRILQPSPPGLNARLNGPELQRMREFCACPQPEDTVIVNLLLNERKDGVRFWNCVHMSHVEVNGRPLILAVQKELKLPMPAALCSLNLEGSQFLTDTLLVIELADFLESLREQLRDLDSVIDIHSSAHKCAQELLKYWKSNCEDFEGDHYVPRLGANAACHFEHDITWQACLNSISASLRKVWEIANFEGDKVALTIADAEAQDCPLVYITEGFEELTGYHRGYVLGRNCRFLQPKIRQQNMLLNKDECRRMSEFNREPFVKDGTAGKPRAFLLVNERKDRSTFWNCLVMEHVQIKGEHYIVGVQTNVTHANHFLVEILSQDAPSLSELARLRAVIHSYAERRLGNESLRAVLKHCVDEWLCDIPQELGFPSFPVATPPLKFPMSLVGLELCGDTVDTGIFIRALETGIRHFHISFPRRPDTRDDFLSEKLGRIMSLKVAEALHHLRKMNFQYLQEVVTFSVRTPPCLVPAFPEMLRAIEFSGYKIDAWLLEIVGVSHEKMKESWHVMSQAQHAGQVRAIGFYATGDAASTLAYDSLRVTKIKHGAPCAVAAIETYPGKADEHITCSNINRLRQAGVGIVGCGIYGPKGRLLRSDDLKEAAAELGCRPEYFGLKWAEEVGMPVLVPESVLADFLSEDDIMEEIQEGKAKTRALQIAALGLPEGVVDLEDRSMIPLVHRTLIRKYYEGPPAALCAKVFREAGGGHHSCDSFVRRGSLGSNDAATFSPLLSPSSSIRSLGGGAPSLPRRASSIEREPEVAENVAEHVEVTRRHSTGSTVKRHSATGWMSAAAAAVHLPQGRSSLPGASDRVRTRRQLPRIAVDTGTRTINERLANYRTNRGLDRAASRSASPRTSCDLDKDKSSRFNNSRNVTIESVGSSTQEGSTHEGENFFSRPASPLTTSRSPPQSPSHRKTSAGQATQPEPRQAARPTPTVLPPLLGDLKPVHGAARSRSKETPRGPGFFDGVVPSSKATRGATSTASVDHDDDVEHLTKRSPKPHKTDSAPSWPTSSSLPSPRSFLNRSDRRSLDSSSTNTRVVRQLSSEPYRRQSSSKISMDPGRSGQAGAKHRLEKAPTGNLDTLAGS